MKPTVGRVAFVRPLLSDPQPIPTIVTEVHADGRVSLRNLGDPKRCSIEMFRRFKVHDTVEEAIAAAEGPYLEGVNAARAANEEADKRDAQNKEAARRGQPQAPSLARFNAPGEPWIAYWPPRELPEPANVPPPKERLTEVSGD